MITYIFNGFDIKKHFGKRVSEFFQKDMKNYEKIVFIPGEFDDMYQLMFLGLRKLVLI